MGDARPAVGDTFGCHRLVRELGRGATATVFEAVHEELGRRVAIKVLDPALSTDEAVRARFRREGLAAARVRHPHVVEVFDVGTSPSPYLVLELVDGGTLETHLATHGPLPPEAAAHLFLPIVSALQHVHAAGIVHRDLKPSNILLGKDLRGHLVPKVSDFGISKLESADALTREHAVLGTVGYMAPEQLRAAATVDGAADRWALGVMLLECVTRRAAFPGETTAQRIRAVLEDEPVGLGEVPPALREVLATLLTRSPRGRFEDDAALGLALARVAGDEAWTETFAGVFGAGPGATLDEVHDTPGNSASSIVATSTRGRARWAPLLGVAIVVVAWMAVRSRARGPETQASTPATSTASAPAGPSAPREGVPSAPVLPSAEPRLVVTPPSSPGPTSISPKAPSGTVTFAKPLAPSASVPAPTPTPTAASNVTAPAPVSTGALGAPILE